MSGLIESLGGRRVVVEFPTSGLERWQAAAEVLIQEDITAFAFHASQAHRLRDAVALFGRRACIGSYGLLTEWNVTQAVDAGARFLTSPIVAPELFHPAASIPLALGALTPNEVAYASRSGSDAVVLTPAEQAGISTLAGYRAMFGDVDLIPSGRLSAPEVRVALEYGFPVVMVNAAAAFSDDGHPNDDLNGLRRRVQALADAVRYL